MTATTSRKTGPVTKEQELADLTAPKTGGKIAIVWEPDREPGASPPLLGARSVRSWTYSWVDKDATDRRAALPNGHRPPAFKNLELLRPGLNWVSRQLWHEAQSDAEARPDSNPIAARIESGAIRSYTPIVDNLTGTLADYSVNDIKTLVQSIYDVDALRAFRRETTSPEVVEVLDKQIRAIETEGASQYGG